MTAFREEGDEGTVLCADTAIIISVTGKYSSEGSLRRAFVPRENTVCRRV